MIHFRHSRRQFLKSATAALLASGGAGRLRGAELFDPFEKTIRELQRAMTDGKTSSAQLVQFYLNRIAAYDQAGPRVNAVLHINPNAAADAQMLDEERKRRRLRGPLHGIPVLLKDNFDTRDMPTTGGALAGIVPKNDAFQVRKLREAGAVILGKVNLHELALGLTTVSSLGGQTLNPYDLTRAPGPRIQSRHEEPLRQATVRAEPRQSRDVPRGESLGTWWLLQPKRLDDTNHPGVSSNPPIDDRPCRTTYGHCASRTPHPGGEPSCQRRPPGEHQLAPVSNCAAMSITRRN
jgi:Amidase